MMVLRVLRLLRICNTVAVVISLPAMVTRHPDPTSTASGMFILSIISGSLSEPLNRK